MNELHPLNDFVPEAERYELQGETVPAIKALRRYLKLAPDAPDRAIIHRRIDRLRAKK